MKPFPSVVCLSLFFVLCFEPLVFAQQREVFGTVLDSASAPIPYASIVVKDDSTGVLRGTVSDLSGRFKLQFDHWYNNDTLKVSSVGFETLFIPVRSLSSSQEQMLRLRESTTTLETVLIEDLTPRDLLRTCIDEIPENYLDVSFLNKAFFWKSIEEDSVYKSLQESFVTIQEHHSLTSSRRSFLYDSVSMVGNPAEVFIEFDNIDNLFYFDFIRTGSGITNTSNLGEWKCEYVRTPTPEFNNSTVIQATRNDKLGEFKIYINAHDYSFARIEFSYKWPRASHHLNDSLDYSLNSVDGIVQYQKTDKKYSIKYFYVSTSYTAYKRYTSKIAFSRNTIFELTLLSSAETKFPTEPPAMTEHFEWKPAIVNTHEYCLARMALRGDGEACE